MALYDSILTSVQSTTTQFINDNVVAVTSAIKAPAITLLSVYVIFWGYSYLMNTVREPITDSLKRLLKIVIIIGIAFEAGTYNSYVVETMTTAPDQMAAVFVTDSGNDSNSVVTALDKVFEDMWDVGNIFWKEGGLRTPGAYFVALAIWGCAIGVSAYSCFLLILSKIAISLLVALGPLFIFSTLFEPTKKFFESWVGLLANYGLVTVFTIATNTFIVSLMNKYIVITQGEGETVVAAAAPLVVTFVISGFLLAQILSLSSALGGGISLSTMGAFLWAGKKIGGGAKKGAGTAGGVAGKAVVGGAKLLPRPWKTKSVAKS